SALLGRLHHHYRSREPGDDPVAGGKSPRFGTCPRRILGHDRPFLRQVLSQSLVLGRVPNVDPTAEHRDAWPSPVQTTAMGRSVDASGEPAHDYPTGTGDGPAHLAGQPHPISCGPPGADDGYTRRDREGSSDPEAFRRVGDLLEPSRIGAVASSQDVEAGHHEPRRANASAMWRSWIASTSSRSASVRATRRMRSYPRAVNPARSTARVRSRPASPSIGSRSSSARVRSRLSAPARLVACAPPPPAEPPQTSVPLSVPAARRRSAGAQRPAGRNGRATGPRSGAGTAGVSPGSIGTPEPAPRRSRKGMGWSPRPAAPRPASSPTFP